MKKQSVSLWSRLSISSKIIVVFLALSVASLLTMGSLSITSMRGAGSYALESSTALGETAIKDSTVSLTKLGEEIIAEKSSGIARQIEIYLAYHPGMSLADISRDRDLRQIAMQSVGKTGYTALVDADKFVILLHQSPEQEGKDLTALRTTLPSFWAVIERSAGGKPSSGYYDWQELDGSVRQKYAAITPIRYTTADSNRALTLWATTYIDEFSQPAQDTKKQIGTALTASMAFISKNIDGLQNVFMLTFIIMVIVVAGLGFWLSKVITRPVKMLKEGVEAVGKGDLDHVLVVNTQDELGDLANAFNKMSSQLKTYMGELQRTTAEKERMARELEIAKGIQQNFLPESAPVIPGIQLAGFNMPAREVGGDFYDFIPISLDRWGLVMADVSGKGVPAALFMALSRTLIRAYATGNPTTSEAILRTNNLIAQDDRSNMFVTLFYGVLDARKRTLTYVNAGHNPPMVMERGKHELTLLEAKGIAIGVMQDIQLEEKEVPLHENDIVLLYTDGVTEAINNQGEQFGTERLSALIERWSDLSPQDMIKRIEQEVTAFSEEQAQFDDFTLMILKVGKSEV